MVLCHCELVFIQQPKVSESATGVTLSVEGYLRLGLVLIHKITIATTQLLRKNRHFSCMCLKLDNEFSDHILIMLIATKKKIRLNPLTPRSNL